MIVDSIDVVSLLKVQITDTLILRRSLDNVMVEVHLWIAMFSMDLEKSRISAVVKEPMITPAVGWCHQDIYSLTLIGIFDLFASFCM